MSSSTRSTESTAEAQPGERFILVTNDDGIESPGLLAAVRAVIGLGRIVVVAPTNQQTSTGRGMTGNWDDRLHRVDFHSSDLGASGPSARDPLLGGATAIEAYHLDASPALAVQHAMNTIFTDRRPDLVVSGINYGENLGADISISGTVGAAIQGASYGIPAIAASQETEIAYHFQYGDVDWAGAIRAVRHFAELLLGDGQAGAQKPNLHETVLESTLPFDVLKIDVPLGCDTETEYRLCRLARRPYFRHTIQNHRHDSPLKDGRTWIDREGPDIVRGTDIHTLAVDRLIAVTPLSLDWTAPLDESGERLGMSRA